jgi:hypothetical protein
MPQSHLQLFINHCTAHNLQYEKSLESQNGQLSKHHWLLVYKPSSQSPLEMQREKSQENQNKYDVRMVYLLELIIYIRKM